MRIVLGAILLWALPAGAREVKSLTVTSPAFASNGEIPRDYTCEGRSVSPPINWSAVPPETKSIAVLVDDPDAPRGTFDHLVLFNLPPGARTLSSQSAASLSGTQGMTAQNDSNGFGFAPICPPSGRHHYRFDVIAMDEVLPLQQGARSGDVARVSSGHIVARGELIGTYQKSAPQAKTAPAANASRPANAAPANAAPTNAAPPTAAQPANATSPDRAGRKGPGHHR